MLSSKNWASPYVERAEVTRALEVMVMERPEELIEERAAVAAVAASATAEAAPSTVLGGADHP